MLRHLSFVPMLALAFGCSEGGPSLPSLPSFHDIESGSAAIQVSARAVVRIHTAGAFGTGAFISATGLLLTNNHVLGAGVCPREGCSVQLTFMHQRGTASTRPLSFFATPTAVDVGLDMAVLQVMSSPGGEPISTPDFLSLADRDAASLQGQHVTVVGHPQGELKKWTDGVVTDAFGDWFATTAYTLPGSSGSPVLDDVGQIVGIIHHGATGEDLITRDSVNVTSLGTAAASLSAALAAPLPSAMISVAAPATPEAIVASNLAYLNGRSPTVVTATGDPPVSVLGVLGAACDTVLARLDFTSTDALSIALQPCNDALTWIECRVDATSAAYSTVCPSSVDLAAWQARFRSMNDLWVKLNGETDLYPVSFGLAALSFSKSAGNSAGAQGLQQALVAAHRQLDFGVSNFLAAFGVTSFADTDALAWLRGYALRPSHRIYAYSIASAFLWWNDNGAVTDAETLTVVSNLEADPEVSVGAKLYLEDVLYLRGH